MTQPEPPHPLDVAFLLHAAELLDGDPQVDDFGPLYAAVARVNARAMERDVYGSLFLKAAALLQPLAKLPCLEHSTKPSPGTRPRPTSSSTHTNSTTRPKQPSRSSATPPPEHSASPANYATGPSPDPEAECRECPRDSRPCITLRAG